jgi:hypothetical protein
MLCREHMGVKECKTSIDHPRCGTRAVTPEKAVSNAGKTRRRQITLYFRYICCRERISEI